jgi:hypothetical protein
MRGRVKAGRQAGRQDFYVLRKRRGRWPLFKKNKIGISCAVVSECYLKLPI